MLHHSLRIAWLSILLLIIQPTHVHGQVLTLKQAIDTALHHYALLQAKQNYVEASKANINASTREYLPDLSISFQQDYGTINGQSGPLYGYRGLSVASSGPALPQQNWNAAFGALYLANVNWDFFAFGRAQERVKVATTALQRDQADLDQERFQQQVRVAAAYLNLLAAQRLARSQQNNLERAMAIRAVVVARALNGLNAGVDSSLANAELSSARIALTNAKDLEAQQAHALAELMGIAPSNFVTDTLFVTKIPASLFDSSRQHWQEHPLLKLFSSRIHLSDEQARYYHTFSYPVFSLFGVYQMRGSGFDPQYGLASPKLYSTDYLKGINPVRTNYVFGIGMVWNMTSPLRVQQQVLSQRFISKALQSEYELTAQRLRNQESLANARIRNALDNFTQAPIQVKAASDAYLQKSVLYRNGLTNIVDLTQALYALNRAETDRDIAFNNVWQALLLKAAALGDFGLFINEF